VIDETPKITEVSIFLTPTIKYTLKSLIYETAELLRRIHDRNAKRVRKGRSCRDPTFCPNHKNIHKYAWSVVNSKSITDNYIANEKNKIIS
jgi:hypothetical protein